MSGLKLYHRKTGSKAWVPVEAHKMYDTQKPGYEYQYFQNDVAAQLDKGYFAPK